jgi:chemotaxis family two-component system sensor histidine kinase/response regulator PixL
MAIHPDVRDQAYRFFMQEAPELLQVIETELLELRQDRTRARVHSLMRAAHSIKGGAANVGLEVIKTLSHRLEDFFRAFYNEDLAIDAELEQLLLQGYDCLKFPLLETIQQGSQYDSTPALAAAEPIFAQIEARLGDFLTGEDQLPTAEEMGIDITKSIFEVDVAQALERLDAVAAHPEDAIAAGELRAQAEVFIGIAELLNLSGLGEIAHLSIAALEQHPEQASEILRVALADFRAAQQAVLAGDRKHGGTASEALRHLAAGAGTGDDWSSETTALTDVFGDVAISDTTDTAEFAEFAAPDVEDVFGALTDTPAFTTPHVEDVFGVSELTSTFAAPNVEDVFGTFTDTSGFTTPAVEDVFGTSELTSDFTTSEVEAGFGAAAATSGFTAPSIEDVFGADSAEPAINPQEPPSVEAVFGSFSDAATSPNLESLGSDISTTAESEVAPGDVFEALTAIEQTFDQLPPLTEPPPLPITTPTPISETEASPSITTPRLTETPKTRTPEPTQSISVKLELSQLERMNNLLGELSINRNKLSLQNEQLQSALRELLSRFGQFRGLGKQLQTSLNKMLINPERYSRSHLQPAIGEASLSLGTVNVPTLAPAVANVATATTIGRSEFDSLELDTYGDIYNLLQAAVEALLQMEETVGDVTLFADQSSRVLEEQRLMQTNLRSELMWARMLPLGDILNRFPRLLRDLSYQYNKPVDLKLSGTGVLVDKAVLDNLYSPLVHLVRNAFDHGIEEPQVRLQQGKPEQGRIEIRAYHRGSRTIIEVIDDGRGIDLERVRAKALNVGLLSPEAAQTATTAQLLECLFEPGFSTAATVSELSGRGVGLDVVRGQLQSLKGNINVLSKPGQGTTFTLRIPLTLSISKLLIAWTGTSLVALPSDSVEEIVVPRAQQLKQSGGQRFFRWREQLIVIHELQSMLPFNCPLSEAVPSQFLGSVPTPAHWLAPLLVLRQGSEYSALAVERLVTEQELVIKSFSSALSAPSYLYGCTILGDGNLVPVLDGVSLLGRWQSQNRSLTRFDQPMLSAQSTVPVAAMRVGSLPTILVVDDSAGMRQTLTLTLEKAGYRVLQAHHGREAIEQLQQNRQIQLVICDIEMPVMNGFEFLTQRRQDPALQAVPVVMLTSRSGDKHRRLAMQLGATDYFTKPYIEQQFLANLKSLLQTPAN